MRKLYWFLGGGVALLAIVVGITVVALSQRQTAYTPPSSVGFAELAAATAKGEPVSPPTATPTLTTANTTQEAGATNIPPSSATAVPLVLQPPVDIIYDDFARLSSGWAPL